MVASNLDALVPDFRDRRQHARQIGLALVPNGIKLQAKRDLSLASSERFARQGEAESYASRAQGSATDKFTTGHMRSSMIHVHFLYFCCHGLSQGQGHCCTPSRANPALLVKLRARLAWLAFCSLSQSKGHVRIPVRGAELIAARGRDN